MWFLLQLAVHFKWKSNLASGHNSEIKPADCKATQQYLELNGIKLWEYTPDINNYNITIHI